jgi:uncharacterized protein
MSLFQHSIPPMIRALNNLSAVLEKGAVHAKAKATDDANYLNMRVSPDMFPLSRQVQIACDMAKGGGARLAGIEPPKHEDNEASFADLQARIAKVVAFLEGLTAAQIDGQEARDITLKSPRGEIAFKGMDYLTGFVLPNVYFHSSMTYALLRGAGVEVGKQDFLGMR